MSNKKETPVSWLVEKMLNKDWYTYKSLEYIQQAKEMEKQQIIDAYMGDTAQFANDARIDYPKSAEQYYNETYGGENNEE